MSTQLKVERIAEIQYSVAKQDVRLLIAAQLVEWARKFNIRTLVGATLPAVEWAFEHTLYTLACYGNQQEGLGCQFYGAEREDDVYSKSLTKMPLNGALYKGELGEIIDGNIAWRDRIGELTDAPTRVQLNFMWADYCRPPSVEQIAGFIAMASKLPDNSMAYLTQCMSVRERGGSAERAKAFKNMRGPLDVVVAAYTLAKLKEANPRRPITRTFRVLYGGGACGTTGMLVLGFHLGARHEQLSDINVDLKTVQHTTSQKNKQLKSRRGSGMPSVAAGQGRTRRKLMVAGISTSKAYAPAVTQILEGMAKGMKSAEIHAGLPLSLHLTAQGVAAVMASISRQKKTNKPKPTCAARRAEAPFVVRVKAGENGKFPRIGFPPFKRIKGNAPLDPVYLKQARGRRNIRLIAHLIEPMLDRGMSCEDIAKRFHKSDGITQRSIVGFKGHYLARRAKG